MNIGKLHIILAIALFFSACGSKSEEKQEETVQPKTPVQVVTVGSGSINDELIFFGTSAYLKRNLVTTPIAAFITKVNVKLGDNVRKGEVLYVMQSKESKALGNDLVSIDSTLTNFGIVEVRASASGVITNLDKQQIGDYVLEGGQLCTIAESNDLVFQVNVPFEFTAFTKIGRTCTLVLPDNSTHKAIFTKALTAMNVAAQTQTILAKSVENLYLPENMIIKVTLNKGVESNRQILPKSCILSDEMMTDFWVMKLINDSTAVKVSIRIGNKNTEKVEVLSPKFNQNDKIISVGNYGLPDTALINTVK